MSTPDTLASPYPGPRPFARGDTIFGREAEVAELVRMLIGDRLVLLYAPSGVGKTSLIEAGLVAAMEAEGFTAPPTIRVGGQPVPLDELPADANRYLFSTLLALESDKAEPRSAVAELVALDLATSGTELRHEVEKNGRDLLLIFDQFEEVLTADFRDSTMRQDFFDQLSRLLGLDRVRVLIAAREEFIGALTPYFNHMAYRPRRTLRLEALRAENARQAMVEPAARLGVTYAPDALDLLVTQLSQAVVAVPGSGNELVRDATVEPLHLQVVCDFLWRSLQPTVTTTIQRDQIEQLAQNTVADRDLEPVDAALLHYYDHTLAELGDQRIERRLRDWIETRLIVGQLRNQVLEGAEASAPPSAQAVSYLIERYLIRREARRYQTWLELSHDRLVRPILISNQRWRASRLSLLQQRAWLWQTSGRPANLLLRGDELRQAETWLQAEDRVLEAEEQALLAESQQAQAQAQAEARRHASDKVRSLATRAIRQIRFGDHDQRAAAWAWQAYTVSYQHKLIERDLVDAALRSVLSKELFRMTLGLPRVTLHAVAMSADGRTLAAGSDAGVVYLWQRDRLDQPPRTLPLPQRGSAVLSLAFAPGSAQLAVGSADGMLRLWRTDDAGAQVAAPLAHAEGTTALAYAQAGMLVSAGTDGQILTWTADLATATPLGRHAGGVLALASHTSRLASGGRDAQVRLWDSQRRQELANWPLPAPVTALAFSPDGTILAVGAGTSIYLLPIAQPDAQLIRLSGMQDAVIGLAWWPDQAQLAGSSTTGQVRLWSFGRTLVAQHLASLARLRPSSRDLRRPTAAAGTLALSGAGRLLVAGGIDGLSLWGLGRPDGVALRLEPGPQPMPVRALGWAAAGTRLVALSSQGLVTSWRLHGSEDPPLPIDQQHVATYGLRVQRRASGLLNPRGMSVDGQGLGCVVFTANQVVTLDLDQPSQGSVQTTRHTTLRAVALAPGGDLLALAGEEPFVSLLKAGEPTARELPRPRAHQGLITGLLAASDARVLAIAVTGPSVYAWDSTQLAEPTILLHDARIRQVALAADGLRLLAAAEDGRLLCWDWSRPAHPIKLEAGPDQPITSLALSHDGTLGAAGCADGTLWLWQIDLGPTNPLVLEGHQAAITALAFSPHQRTLASGDAMGVVCIWITDLDQLAMLVQQRLPNNAAAHSPTRS